jgi:hypothetical protein
LFEYHLALLPFNLSLQKTIGFLQTYDPFEPSLFITNHVAKGGLVV